MALGPGVEMQVLIANMDSAVRIAGDPRALGSEGARRPSGSLLAIRLTFDPHAESRAGEASVAAQVEPTDACLLAARATVLEPFHSMTKVNPESSTTASA